MYRFNGFIVTTEERAVWLSVTELRRGKERDGRRKEMYGCVLFYLYIEFGEDGSRVVESAQRKLCKELGLFGRLRVASEGINGTLSGTQTALDSYQTLTKLQLEKYCEDNRVHIDWKRELHPLDSHAFANLQVRLCREIVTLGILPDKVSFHDAGQKLSPKEFAARLSENPSNSLVLDCRNRYESKLGHFSNAVCPETRAFHDFPSWLESNRDLFIGRESVLMYCTGGVRCERASALLKHQFNINVFQLEGGVVRYLEEFPDAILGTGDWRGALVMFDGRRVLMRQSESDNDKNSSFQTQCDGCGEAAGLFELGALHSELDRCDYCRVRLILCSRQCSLEVPENIERYVAQDRNILCSECNAGMSKLKKPNLLFEHRLVRKNRIQCSL